MSRLFSGTPFDRPQACKTCGRMPTECRCQALPEKKKMADRPGGKHPQPDRLDSGLVLTPANSSPPPDQLAKIRVEKRKGNRMVTVVTGMDHPANDLATMCTELKQKLGIGGSVQARTIELQGEHADKVLEYLTARKLRARIV